MLKTAAAGRADALKAGEEWGSFGDKLIPFDNLGIERRNSFCWPSTFGPMAVANIIQTNPTLLSSDRFCGGCRTGLGQSSKFG
jgi:hypothetical protein